MFSKKASLYLPVDRESEFVVLGSKRCKQYLLSAEVQLAVFCGIPPFRAHCPLHRRTSPAFNNRFRIIHRFDKANSVVCCAVSLTKPRKRTSRITKLALDHAKGMFNLGPHLRFGVFDLAAHATDQALLCMLL